MQQPTPSPLTYAEFRAFCAAQDGRFELVDGQPVALDSPSKSHGRLALSLGAQIRGHLSAQRCDAYLHSDVWTGKGARRPDVAVTCDEADITNDDDLIRFPVLLIEILSDNMGEDLRAKLDEYQSMPTIKEYVVIDSRKRWVRHYYRNADGKLVFDHDVIAGSIRLASIGYGLDIATLYDEARIK